MVRNFKNITQTIIIPPNCRERFLSVQTPAGAALRAAGIISGGLSELRAPYEIRRPRPEFHAVIFTLAGRARYETAAASGWLRPGDLWLAPARRWHIYRSAARWDIAWLTLAEAYWPVLGETPTPVLPSPYLEPLRAAMAGYWSECSALQNTDWQIAATQAELIVAYLKKMLPPMPAENPAERSELAELWKRVDAELGRPWRIEELAALVRLSPASLYRLVRRLCATTPLGLVAGLRLRRAGELLRTTDYKLELIAQLVGYGSAFALSRAFRKHYGRSPRQWRGTKKP